MGPGTDFNKERYSDSDKQDSFIIDKKGDWYQIAMPFKDDIALLFWVHKDYFIVQKKEL